MALFTFIWLSGWTFSLNMASGSWTTSDVTWQFQCKFHIHLWLIYLTSFLDESSTLKCFTIVKIGRWLIWKHFSLHSVGAVFTSSKSTVRNRVKFLLILPIFWSFYLILAELWENCEYNGHSVCARIPSCSCRTALESHFIFTWTIEAVNAITFFIRCTSLDGTISLILRNCMTVLH